MAGSAKLLKDEHVHDVIKKHDSIANIIEESEEEEGIVFTPHNANVPLSGKADLQ